MRNIYTEAEEVWSENVVHDASWSELLLLREIHHFKFTLFLLKAIKELYSNKVI